MTSTTQFSNQKLGKSSLKPLKGKSWTWFSEKPIEVQPSSTLNISTPLIPEVVPAPKQIIKIPSNWKLVPIKMSDIPATLKIPTDASSTGSNVDSSGIIKGTLLCPTNEFFFSFLVHSWTSTIKTFQTASGNQQNNLSSQGPSSFIAGLMIST